MAITVNWYGLGLLSLLDTPTDLEGVTVNLALVTDAYTPNRDTDDFRNDFTASELANGNGYTTGGVTLTGVTWSYDATSDQVRLDCNDPTWTFTAAKTWRYGVGYIDTGGADSTDPLIFLLTWDANQTVSTAYTLTIDAAGLLYLDVT
jgi:hypothetical protein